MADQEHEHEQEHDHDIILEETPVEKVQVDPSILTPTSPEVISRFLPHFYKRY
jgi:hypothetical protein